MQREQVLNLMRQHKAEIVNRFGVATLALFGSTARNEAREDSDVDILVAFNATATAKRYFGVQFYLEDILGHPVDLVTPNAVREEVRPYIERDLAYI